MGDQNRYRINRTVKGNIPRDKEVRARTLYAGISIAKIQQIALLEDMDAPELASTLALKMVLIHPHGDNWLWEEERVEYSISKLPLLDTQYGMADVPVYLLTVTTKMKQPHEY